jgi:ferredoxin-NADP reductase
VSEPVVGAGGVAEADGVAGAGPADDPYAWLPATIVSTVAQTSRARSLTLEVPGLRRARAGQHVDLRLTADDGYTAVRSYSVSDVRGSGDSGGAGSVPQIEVTVERLDDGEVSPYLVDAAEPGDPIEVRGPIGGWFVWPPTEFDPDSAVHAVLPEPEGAPSPTSAPVQLIGGGSGVAPLVAMVRARGRDAPPMRLLASVRDPGSRWFVAELDEAARASSAGAAPDIAGGAAAGGAAAGGAAAGGAADAASFAAADGVPGVAGGPALGAGGPAVGAAGPAVGTGGPAVGAGGPTVGDAVGTPAPDGVGDAAGTLGSQGGQGPGSLSVDWVYSRVAPDGHGRAAGRLTRDELERLVLPASEHPLVYVCGANSFVAVVAGWLVELGHAPTRVRTERFGGV